jgi:hypothetical protein
MRDERAPSHWPRLVIGVGVAAIGAIELAANLDLADPDRIYPVFWPAALGALALAFLLGRAGHPTRVWGWLFAALAVIFAVRGPSLEIPLWPVALILAGFALVRRALAGPRPEATADGSAVSSFAMMSGLEQTNRSAAFRGGDLTAVMGGVGLDLRGARLAPEGATLEVFALWGGIEVTVPEGWAIDLKVLPLLGGFDDKTRPADAAAAGPRLTIRGTVLMAGGEVHH